MGNSISGQTLVVGRIVEWISSRHLPFSINELGDEIELKRDQTKRYITTMEMLGWVKEEPHTNGCNEPKRYRPLIRIRRLNGSASAG
jgi:DNA-binding IclR family transcriptional regulator